MTVHTTDLTQVAISILQKEQILLFFGLLPMFS